MLKNDYLVAKIGVDSPLARPRRAREGTAPDVVSYSTAAAACQRAKRWEEAVGLLQRLEAAGGVRREY